MRGLLDKREDVLTRLERAELERRGSKSGEEPKIWTGRCFCLGDRVGAVGYLTEELNYCNTEVCLYAEGFDLSFFFCNFRESEKNYKAMTTITRTT